MTRDTYDGTLDSPASQNHYAYTHGNPVMYTDPSGYMTISGAINTISLQGTLGGIRTGKLALSRKGVFDTLTKGIGLDGRGPVLRSVVNFVVEELTGFDSGTSNPAASGTKAHTKLKNAIGEFKPLGKWVKLVPEVSLCPLGLPIPYNKTPYKGYNMRIDIQVYFKEKLIFIADLKTGKSGMSKSKCKEYSKRHGGVPVVEIFLPFN